MPSVKIDQNKIKAKLEEEGQFRMVVANIGKRKSLPNEKLSLQSVKNKEKTLKKFPKGAVSKNSTFKESQ